ncbi:unnamed protein product [Cylicocyclus nassatus]|uniref:Uncharacterized protein n=1 Tax=Cylicocyclus nassatus TaxID=53992 RepID=A0AA36HBB2_CYLNA|nr:unnamed protein product [Cylicocyclus nassatus]
MDLLEKTKRELPEKGNYPLTQRNELFVVADIAGADELCICCVHQGEEEEGRGEASSILGNAMEARYRRYPKQPSGRQGSASLFLSRTRFWKGRRCQARNHRVGIQGRPNTALNYGTERLVLDLYKIRRNLLIKRSHNEQLHNVVLHDMKEEVLSNIGWRVIQFHPRLVDNVWKGDHEGLCIGFGHLTVTNTCERIPLLARFSANSGIREKGKESQ